MFFTPVENWFSDASLPTWLPATLLHAVVSTSVYPYLLQKTPVTRPVLPQITAV